MKRMLLMFMTLFVSATFSFAQQMAVIDNELQQVLENSTAELINVNIVLKSEADKSKVNALRSAARGRESVRNVVACVLKEHADNSQVAVLDILLKAEKEAGKVTEILSHWISNSITCNATKEVIYQLAAHPDVLAIGYNKVFKIVDCVESFNNAEALASSHSATPHVIQVNADDVWSKGYTGKNVVVAVLDSGTNPDHYDLKDHLWVGYADTDGDGEKDDPVNGWNFISNNSYIADDYGHGTHCAGIVCGDGTVGNITGVAPDATLMTVKIVNRAGGGSVAQMISGVQFALENGAHILSMSLGFKQSQIGVADVVALRRVFENTLEAGIVVCAAAGNDGGNAGELKNVDYPAACPPPYIHPDQAGNSGGKTSVICVGSVNSKDEHSSTSSIGPVTWQGTEFNDYLFDDTHIGLIRPDVCAPGEMIYSLKHDENNKYKLMSGTSQATPCVAGVVALMLEKNSTLTPAQICETLETTAKKLSDSKNNYTGSGRVDALAAINSIEAGNAKPFIELVACSPGVAASGETINVDFELLNSGKGDADKDVVAKLFTSDPYITIVNGEAALGKMASGKGIKGHFAIDVHAETPNGHMAYMDLVVTAGEFVRSYNVVVKVTSEAKIVYSSYAPDYVKPGENVKISVDFVNAGTVPTVGESNVRLVTKSPYVTMVSDEAVLEAMDVNEVRSAEFTVNISEDVPDNNNINFDLYAVPDNYTAVKDIVYEFEPGFDDYGYITDGLDGWTTFDASNDGRNHPWWHSSKYGVHRVEKTGDAKSGSGQMMSESYCLAAMIEYSQPIDNYLVSPVMRITPDSKFSFMARVHANWCYGEHFGVAVSEGGNSSADDFTTIKEWTITKSDGSDWLRYEVDLSAYSGKDVYVAIRHFFTNEQWAELDNGYDAYILHIDDAQFDNVIDISTKFVYDNYSYFSVIVDRNSLPAPADVVAKAVDDRSVVVNWSAVEKAQEYCVYRDGKYLATTTELSYTDSGLLPDTEYDYSVSAIYDGKKYERSAEVPVRTGKAEYSMTVKKVSLEELVLGENVIEITIANNGMKELASEFVASLQCASSYVMIKTGELGLSSLKAGEERILSFVVEVDETIPHASNVNFKLNVAEHGWNFAFVLSVNSKETSAVESVGQDNPAGAVYDLSGRKVENPVKGIYVVNGKKVYVRQ